MTKDEVIDQLWERSNHGTRREDVVAAYEAGAEAEREEANRKANAGWALMCKKMVEAEREECAKMCETVGNHNITAACAAAIRARSEA